MKISDFTICGYYGSEAQKYADENGFKFISLGDMPEKYLSLVGDSDDDGFVTIIDATCIQRYLAGLSNTSFNEKAADADEDGFVTIIDATSIQRHLASLPTNENIGKPIK